MDESNVVFGHNEVGEPDDDFNFSNMAANSTEDDEILTASQVSKLLKLHQKTIYKLAKKGKIPGRQVGKVWRFLKSEIIKFLEKKDV